MPTSSSRGAKRPRTVSLTNSPPPTSSQLSHPHTSLSSSTLSLSSLPNVTLETGMNVFVSGADFGVVKYIGTTDFAKGVWLGIELKRPSVLCVSYDTLYIQEGTHSHTYCSLSPLLSLSLPPSLPPSPSLILPPLPLSPSPSPSLSLPTSSFAPTNSPDLISRLGLALGSHAYKTLSEITNANL